ncbi:hypothetical protein FGO68_gene13704 [Halteria grandinella]|uniref:Uncharacterized protein n=1 Tax=Halteria grandinella TaxID=5974 RepID=A0A8J8NTA2_HALGN|nr:hypothetical protein FGO68_gene13704 [Halteria grandinella]
MWSLDQLNQHAQPDTTVEWAVFEGAKRKGWTDLEQGLYYGQLRNQKRHGKGIVFATEKDGRANLYECEWNEGTPINHGRCIIITSGWEKYEGTFDCSYLLNGPGSKHREDGHIYQGGFKHGKYHGQGKVIWKHGGSYEGGWLDDFKHGSGRQTDEQGGYREGQWKKDFISSKPIGIHKYYDKEGKLLKTENHGGI